MDDSETVLKNTVASCLRRHNFEGDNDNSEFVDPE